MEFLLLLMGAACVVAFIINNVARTALRHTEISKWELRLAFFAALLPVSALVVDNLERGRFGTLEQIMFLLIIPLTIVSIGLFVVEGFRPQRWRQSRGVFGLGIALLLTISTLSYHFVSLNAQLSIVERSVVPTPVNAAPDELTPCERAFAGLGTIVFDRIREYTGLDEDALTDEFIDGQRSLSQIIQANDREPTGFVNAVVSDFEDELPDLVSQECLTPLQAAGAPLLIRTQLQNVVNTRLADVLTLFEGAFGGGDDTDANTVTEADEADLRATRVALLDNLPTEPVLPSPTATSTPSVTPSPTVTRTPFPTLSPTPTRERYQTPTPTLTATLPNPCLATASFNVNMRTQPDLDESDVILTIPFDAVFSVFAPNEDKTWWFGQYEGEAGWIKGEFIALTRPCDDLPPRDP